MILFITRKHPPSIGGMQKLSQSLTVEVGKLRPTATISWGRSTIFLPFFLIYALARTLYILPRNRKIQLIHLSDALLAPLGVFLKTLFRIPVVVTVHGLDITYSNPAYQWLIPRCLMRMDKLICVSTYTRDQCIRRAVPAELCEVIPNGVNVEEFGCGVTQRGITNVRILAGAGLDARKVLLTVGRLIERKGVVHFIDRVLPRVLDRHPNTTYLIVGEGPLRDVIETRITSLHLQEQVVLLGRVDDATLRAAYHLADLFVMPNIPVPNDIEGFGLVALEAAAAGLYVVASRLDGIPEAVVEGENGTLVDPVNATAFAALVNRLLQNDEERKRLGKRAQDYVRAHYSWDIVAGRYNELFNRVIQAAHQRGDLPRKARWRNRST